MYLSSNVYIDISLLVETVSHHFRKWLIQFSYLDGISLYINKAK